MLHIDHVKGLVGVDQAEVSHRTPEHCDEVGKQGTSAAIGADVDQEHMVALSKGQQEDTKQHHEKYHLVADCDKHCCEEIQLLENPYEVNYFDQRHDYTEAKQNLHQVCSVIIEKV